MPSLSAYLLVTHGSRDPRSQAALDQLAQLFTQALANQGLKTPMVHTGTLEFGATSLDIQIQQLGAALMSQGIFQLKVIPLFLLPGNHVMVDIPTAVAAAQSRLGSQLQLQVQSHLGTHPLMGNILRDRIGDRRDHPWILLSHGSSRPRGNQPINILAAQLGALPAYWTSAPTLETQVQTVALSNPTHIGVLPYFLFAGRITDAIVQQVRELQSMFNQLCFIYTPPLEANTEMAHLLLDLI